LLDNDELKLDSASDDPERCQRCEKGEIEKQGGGYTMRGREVGNRRISQINWSICTATKIKHPLSVSLIVIE
jgi:hypothetical protein